MANRKPLIDGDGEVRGITPEDVAIFKPFSALPEAERKMLTALRLRDSALDVWLLKDVFRQLKP